MPPLSLEELEVKLQSSFSAIDNVDVKYPPLDTTELPPVENEVACSSTASLSSSSSSTSEARAIRFATYDEVFEIPHIDDLSDEEVEDVWMSSEYLDEIRAECKEIVLDMSEQGDDFDEEGTETRGLKEHLPETLDRRKAVQYLLYEAVDRIQSFQREQGIEVSHLIAEMCTKYSSISVKAAEKIGTSDAIAAHC